MMLWFGLVSLLMSFAGWTSAYIVSSKRSDWMNDIQIPQAFIYSTLVILVSSVVLHMGYLQLKKGNSKNTTLLLWITLLLGITFIILQIQGFNAIINSGYHFTGPTSNITMSYIYVITGVHILHVIAGLIVLSVLIYNHFKQAYSPSKTLGFQLGLTFWHFLGLLWLYLILFFYFYR